MCLSLLVSSKISLKICLFLFTRRRKLCCYRCMSALHLWHHFTGAIKKMTSAPSLSLQRCCPWLPSIFAFCAADGTIDLYPWWTGDTPSCVCSDCLTHHCLKYFWRVCHMCLECTVKSFHGLSVYSKTVFWLHTALAMLVDYQKHNICYS